MCHDLQKLVKKSFITFFRKFSTAKIVDENRGDREKVVTFLIEFQRCCLRELYTFPVLEMWRDARALNWLELHCCRGLRGAGTGDRIFVP